jgi:glycogen debranching enzyme
MDAFEIAKRDLRACYGKEGIFAGLHHFRDYWARDSFFASLGSLEIGDFEIVKSNLELFLKYEKKGQIPLRIGKSTSKMLLSVFFNANGERRPHYSNGKTGKIPVDQNSLFIIALHAYVTKTNEKEILIENKEKIGRIIEWNLKRTKELLIYEDEYCNWADSIKKRGFVLYSNVCHCHALKCYHELYGIKKYHSLYLKTKEKINEVFWSGEHYIDWIDDEKHYNYFSTDGNMLAVIWEIADKDKARHIEEAAHIFEVNETPSGCVHPKYPKSLAYCPLRLVGLGDYHNGLSWLWLGAISSAAKKKIGMDNEAKEMIEKISALISRYGEVFEVYEKGMPVKRMLYKSEKPFAWSSGLFVYAYSKILNDKKKIK